MKEVLVKAIDCRLRWRTYRFLTGAEDSGEDRGAERGQVKGVMRNLRVEGVDPWPRVWGFGRSRQAAPRPRGRPQTRGRLAEEEVAAASSSRQGCLMR